MKTDISPKHAHRNFDKNFKSSGEPQIILSWMYLGYKSLLSSQDGESCVYYPSCSTYSIRSIQQKGPIIGVMATFDRLTRCNPMAIKYYPVYVEKARLFDPVDKSKYELPKESLQYLPDF